MLFRILKKVSLKSPSWIKMAVLEILLIFIGINLSLYFNNWNEERKKESIQLDILKELLVDIEQDSIDIKSSIDILNRYVVCYNTISDLVTTSETVADSILEQYKPVWGNTFFNTNQIAYENYKLKGLEFVKSNALRRAIMTYYEDDIHLLRKREEWMSNIDDKYVTNLWLNYYYYEGVLTRSSFNQLRHSTKDKAILRIAKDNYEKHLKCYMELNTSCSDLKGFLKREIDRLES
ncbi:MAG: hypothetical protein JEZ14_22610 [Marinilabiliaceae bacterium]|nr:hypothetical protein [Marinilabiliaceae bacterium]